MGPHRILPIGSMCFVALLLVLALLGTSPTGVPSAAAAGCFPARAHAAGSFTAVIETPDGQRSYRLHVPGSYDGSQTVALLLSLHGLGSSAAEEEYLSGLTPLSDSSAGGFIVAYPQAVTGPAIPLAHWNAWQLATPEPDDVAFIAQLIDNLESQLCIARDRVYAQGFSNGAMMAVRLACSLPDRIAAVSAFSGLYYPPLSTDNFPNPAETCEGTRPVPVVAFHGTADPVVPYTGGKGIWNITYQPIEGSLAAWARHNGCTGGPTGVALSAQARLISYGACIDGANAQLYVVDGAGHGWPPLAPDPQTGKAPVDTARQTWEFFSHHSLPGACLSNPQYGQVSNPNHDCPKALPPCADYTGDRVVNVADFAYVVARYRQPKPPGGIFSVWDLSQVILHYRETCPT